MYFLVSRACAVTVCMSSYPINDTLLCFRLPRVGVALEKTHLFRQHFGINAGMNMMNDARQCWVATECYQMNNF